MWKLISTCEKHPGRECSWTTQTRTRLTRLVHK
uniref:Uncharacterized protein n=1 Tax=Anguilla anguilla TaxID=7936 RepID=A0A0E9TPJ2_ANGAN